MRWGGFARGGSETVIPYASRTGTKKNLAVLRANGWRLMVSAKGVLRTEGFQYALDNGAWHCHQHGLEFDVEAFEKALGLLGEHADFVVAPDIVMGGMDSLELSLSWLSRLNRFRLVLIPVQDGFTEADMRTIVNERTGVFVGGSTEWKLATIPLWASFGNSTGAYVHVGRVNTRRRIRLCMAAGAHSFDGSGPSMFSKCAEQLSREMNQGSLLLFER